MQVLHLVSEGRDVEAVVKTGPLAVVVGTFRFLVIVVGIAHADVQGRSDRAERFFRHTRPTVKVEGNVASGRRKFRSGR